MSDIYGAPSPVLPQATPQAPVAPNPLVPAWQEYMANERNRAMLMQMGVNLMQPMASGQNVVGHLGQAIGAAGEAGDRFTAAELAQRKQANSETDVESKAMLRGAQADTAEARANTAATRAGAATDRLAATRENAMLAARVRLQGMYATDVARVRKQNDDNALYNPTAPKVPVPTFEEWVGKNPGLAETLGGGSVAPSGASNAPKPGEERDGFIFRGGNPGDPNSWRKK